MLDSTVDEDTEDGEVLPVPMVDVSRMDDDDLSSHSVSQFAIPAPTLADDFIPVSRRGGASVRSAQTAR